MQFDHAEEREGFIITLTCLPEYAKPDWDMTDKEKIKLRRDIKSGKTLWFCAKVSAIKGDRELASDYLGGCCYDDINQFLNDVYYQDMVETVIIEAKQAIKELNK